MNKNERGGGASGGDEGVGGICVSRVQKQQMAMEREGAQRSEAAANNASQVNRREKPPRPYARLFRAP